MDNQPTDELPRINGRFRLVQRMASGATAEVWRAHDDQLDRPVAVKLLHPHLLPDDRSRRRFEAEAASVAALAHPGIVAVYDVDVKGERPALVLELVEGESLAARLQRERRLPERDVAGIGAEVGDALLHAHQRGIVHRDVKPGNILLDRLGRARLVDFGIARSLAESADRLTLTGTVVGTPAYMAPEQLAGATVGPRTDVYALGVVLYEALAGKRPFLASSPLALADEQRAGPPPLEWTDPDLAAIVGAALAFDPEKRPRTAGVMADAQRDWLAGRPVGPLAVGGQGPGSGDGAETMVATAAAAAPSVAGAPPSREPGRRPLLIGSALGLAAVAAVLALALMLPSSPGVAPPAAADPTPTAASTPQQQQQAGEGDADEGPPPDADAEPGGNRGQSGRLPRPIERLVDEYYEECGEEAPPPPNVAGMKKDEAEDLMEPLIEACKDHHDD